MSYVSMVTVQAGIAGDTSKLVEAANVLLELFAEQPTQDKDAYTENFLYSIANARAIFYGNKSDVLLWGGGWNYFREEDFTPWLARLIESTPDEWLTNIHLSWECEQSEKRETKVFWFHEDKKLVWTLVPSVVRMHWGVLGDESPGVHFILDIDGEKHSCDIVCERCGCLDLHWEGDYRYCPNCKAKRPVIHAHYWKDEGED